MTRRNKVVIVMTSKDAFDEEALKEHGYTEAQALAEQEVAIEDMLSEFMVYEDFDVELTVSIEEEEV